MWLQILVCAACLLFLVLTLFFYRYWGVENPYMEEYHKKGGSEFDRDDFWKRWSPVAKLPNQSLEVIYSHIRQGKALIQCKPGW